MNGESCGLAIHGGTPAVTDADVNQDLAPEIEYEVRKSLDGLILSGETACYGKEGIVSEFEDKFASYHNTRYALSHNSGTSALHAAYFAIGIAKGDEVIAPTYTFHATVTPLIAMGGVPVFCNMDQQTLNIDAREIEQSITAKTKAIVVTHMWGYPCDMDSIVPLARKHRLYLIEDCSQAHGAIYKGRRVGSFGHVACFSLARGKPISAGHGGMFITNSEDLYERAVLLGHFGERSISCVNEGSRRMFVETGFGFNYHMSPLHAAIGKVYLKYLDKVNEIADGNMRYLGARLANVSGIGPPINGPDVRRACYGCKPKYLKDELRGLPMDTYVKALQAEGVGVKIPDSKPLHALPSFTRDPQCHQDGRFFYKTFTDLSISERIFDSLLSLAVFRHPAKDTIDQYVEAFEKVACNVAELS